MHDDEAASSRHVSFEGRLGFGRKGGGFPTEIGYHDVVV